MSRRFAVVPSILVGIGLLALAGFASSVVPKEVRKAETGIAEMIRVALEADEKVRARQVEVETREGVVYLTGIVDTEESRCEAGRVAWRTASVAGVVNGLTVGERTVGGWVDDEILRSRVESRLLAKAVIRTGDIDVSSSRGTVTLFGRVASESIRSEAERIARDTRGVQRVLNHLLAGRIRS